MSIYGKGVMVGGGKKPIPLSVSNNGTWNRDGGYNPIDVSVPASAVTSGTKSITANGDYDVTEFKNVNVVVQAPNKYLIQVTVDAGSSVTATYDGDFVAFTEVSSGVYWAWVQRAGVWTVTASKSGATASAQVSVPSNYTLAYKASAFTVPQTGISYVNGLPSDWNIMKEIGMAISEASGSISANTTGTIYINKGNMWAYKITPGNTINVNNHLYAVMGFNNYQLTNKENYGGTHTTAGLTFGAVDCITVAKMNSTNTNSGGWGKCLMRTTMSTLQSGMPDTLAEVRVPYVDYNNQSTILYSDDYMFLPAEKEVFGARSYSPTTEANVLTQFAYYKNGGSKIKSHSGSAVYWWLRSVYYNSNGYFCGVNLTGGVSQIGASLTYGAPPCFCV